MPGEDAVDWNAAVVRPVYRAAVALATLARDHAVRLGGCDPDEAWACGLLTPLGWLGVCAADPAAAAACLADPEFIHNPSQIQRRRWGLDQFALSRRLARRWRLPDWLTAVIGCLHLPPELARSFGPDPALLSCVRRAVEEARACGVDLGLGKVADSLRESARPIAERLAHDRGPARKSWESPYRSPLLRDLLVLAAENRRLREAAHGVHLEARSRSIAPGAGRADGRRGRPAEGRQARRPGGVRRRRRP